MGPGNPAAGMDGEGATASDGGAVIRALFLSSARPRLWGGGEKWLVTVGAALRARGHAITIAGRPGSRLLRAAEEAGIPIAPVHFRGDLDPRTLLRVRALIAELDFDLILNTFDKEARVSGLAARSLGPRRRVRVLCRKGLPLLEDNWRYRLTYGHFVDGILTPAGSIRRRLEREHPWLRVPIEVLPNGVDLERFPFRAARAPAPDPRWPPVALGMPRVVHLARLSGQKGHRVLLEAVARLQPAFPGARYVLVGDGAEAPAIEAERARLALEPVVFLAGHRTDTAAVLAAADIVVLPSLEEGFPNVLLEAMATGRPVVASAVGDCAAIVRDGETGYLVPPGEVAPFAERLAMLMESPALRVQMGEAARARAAAEHGAEQMIAGAERYLRREAALVSGG
jgi:glycosyltransferase involved in cell wall biosynthesis